MGAAFEVAESGGGLVTIGIIPTFPATGYGYIRRGEKFSADFGEYYKVARFFEKPNFARAAEYAASGEFYWNAGIFVWKTSAILAAIEKTRPRPAKSCAKSPRRRIPDFPQRRRGYTRRSRNQHRLSVMERADNAWTVPAQFDWDDVGSWAAAERHMSKGADGNAAVGELFAADSKNCAVFDAAGRATALMGVDGLVVVHSKDATLVCKKSPPKS